MFLVIFFLYEYRMVHKKDKIYIIKIHIINLSKKIHIIGKIAITVIIIKS